MENKFTLEYGDIIHTSWEAANNESGPLLTLNDCDYWFGELAGCNDIEIAIVTELERDLVYYVLWKAKAWDREGKPNAWDGTMTCHKRTAEDFVGMEITGGGGFKRG